jgi:hypothetical protein
VLEETLVFDRDECLDDFLRDFLDPYEVTALQVVLTDHLAVAVEDDAE